MRTSRRILFLFLFFVIAGGVWAAVYVQKKGFYGTWRELVEDEFAKREIYTKIGKVTLGPLQGLVAEDVYLYLDPEKLQEIAFVNNVILDLDLTEILNRDLSINTLDVQDGSLYLPLSPGKRDSEMLEVDRFSGRLVMTESRIEIVKAKADLQGIAITLKGSLHRPARENEEVSGQAGLDQEEQRRKLRELGRRIGALQAVLQEIDRMEFDPFGLPRLEVEFNGDLADLGGLRASARLFAEDFQRDSYAVQALSASMEFDGEKGRANLKELHLRDSKGDLRLRADWPVGSKEITFDLDSNADLPALLSSIFPNPRLGEVVFYHPRLKMEGTIKLDELEKAEFPRLPLDAIGHFSSDRIGSRGTVFDGLEFNFSISGDRSYVRNLRLEHRSGSLLANLMFDPALGSEAFRYQSEMKMEPKVFLPFVNSAGARRFLSMWEFNQNSNIYVAAMGSGPDLNPDNWHSRGIVDLRRLRLNNIRFNRLEANFEFQNQTQSYRDVRLAGVDGLVVAPEATYHADSQKWEVKNLKWSLDLVEGARAFSPDLSRELARHQFSRRPDMKINGIIDTRKKKDLAGDSRQHDFQLSFESDQSLRYDFMGQTLSLKNPAGSVAVKGDSFELSKFTAGLFGGTLEADLRSEGGEKKSGDLTIRDADLFAIPPFRPLSKLIADSIEGASINPGDATSMSADLNWENGILTTENLKAETDSFNFSANGRIDSIRRTVQLDATVDPSAAETGKTLHFTAEGSFGDPKWEAVPRSDP